MIVLNKVLRSTARRSLSAIRKADLNVQESSIKLRKIGSRPIIFNLDLHVSVIRDLAVEFSAQEISLCNWSISGSNKYFRTFYKVSDPVEVVNSSTWSKIDRSMIERFQDRYGHFLRQFDGFVVTHTPAFAQLYQGLDKPVLVLNSTRYEAPFTNNMFLWSKLNQFLVDFNETGRLVIASNNRGDRDYLLDKTGISSELVPSVCDYTNFRWQNKGTGKVVVSRSPVLDEFIKKETSGQWLSIRALLGSNFKWKDFERIEEILYIPYNISTMSLFEFATAGIPVSVPSPELLFRLMNDHVGVLSELSYFQTRGLSPKNLSETDPNNYLSENFYSWWISRSDFYDSSLMPNIRVISDFSELETPHPFMSKSLDEVAKIVELRNRSLKLKREKLVHEFKNLF